MTRERKKENLRKTQSELLHAASYNCLQYDLGETKSRWSIEDEMDGSFSSTHVSIAAASRQIWLHKR
jgi:hypothetical protein